MNAASWRAKAAALLWPTPLSALDPEGEPRRRGKLERCHAWLALSDEAAARAERVSCLADGIQRGGTLPTPLAVPSCLVHPLSKEALDPVTDDLSALEELWESRLAALEEPTDTERWRKLWRAWVAPAKPDALDRIPGDGVRQDYPALARASLAAALAGILLDDVPALLLVHVGPVQSFIDAARRTQDLWAGSYTVGWLAYLVAETLATDLGPEAVIYPFLGRHPIAARRLWLDRFDASEDRRRLLQPANGNKVLAVVPSERLNDIVSACRRAVDQEWDDLAAKARQHLEPKARHPDWSGWDCKWSEQIKDFVEFSAVAVPWGDDTTQLDEVLDHAGLPRPAPEEGLGGTTPSAAYFGPLYGLAHQTLGGVRRAVVPAPWNGDSRPKCVLDGIREQMGPENERGTRSPAQTQRAFWRDLRSRTADDDVSLQIKDGEGLSAVSLAKRFSPQLWYGAQEAQLGFDWCNTDDRPLLRFPSTRSFAAVTWRAFAQERTRADGELRKARDEWGKSIAAVHDDLEFKQPGNLFASLGSSAHADGFLSPDGDWLFVESYDIDRAIEEHGCPGTEARSSALQTLLAVAERHLRRLYELLGTSPTPYYAVLALDVDHMGQWLTGRHDALQGRPLVPALHGALSERLGRLASEQVPKIVDAHLGRVVFCGGDDVLAMLPLHTALPCAAAVRAAIASREGLGHNATASAGIAVAHSLAPLRCALVAARAAEKKAKEERDRVCVNVRMRSGPALELTSPWSLGSGLALDEGIGKLVDATLPDEGGSAILTRARAVELEERHLRRRPKGQFRHRLEQLLPIEDRTFLDAVLEERGSEDVLSVLRLARFLRKELPADSLDTIMRIVRAEEGP